MNGYYKIVRLYCYDCNKRSKIINNQPVCTRCGSKNCTSTSIWTKIVSPNESK